MNMKANQLRRAIFTQAQWNDVTLDCHRCQKESGLSKKVYYEQKFEAFVRDAFNFEGQLPSLPSFYSRVAATESLLFQHLDVDSKFNQSSLEQTASSTRISWGTYSVNPDQKVKIIPIVGQDIPSVAPTKSQTINSGSQPTPSSQIPASTASSLEKPNVRRSCALLASAVCRLFLRSAAGATKAMSETLFRLAN